MSKLSPGSNEARFMGCICPVRENNYGKGIFTDPKTLEVYGGPVFWYDDDCSVHRNEIGEAKQGRVQKLTKEKTLWQRQQHNAPLDRRPSNRMATKIPLTSKKV